MISPASQTSKSTNLSTLADAGHDEQLSSVTSNLHQVTLNDSEDKFDVHAPATPLDGGSKFKESSPSPVDTKTSGGSSGSVGKSSGKSAGSLATAGTPGSPSSPHKSTFMDKIRGEAKLISGKLGKNEEKMEEGRRLLGKSS